MYALPFNLFRSDDRFKVPDFVARYPGAAENAAKATKKHGLGETTNSASSKKAKKTSSK
jgi:hypothetical protein